MGNQSRRQLLQNAGLGLVASPLLATQDVLPAWIPGTLEIHHISTGRGSCAFLICPDGTTIMVDCGSIHPEPDVAKYVIGPKPDGSRRPAEWIARYVQRRLHHTGPARIDYFILTHLHGDHCGELDNTAPLSKFKSYRLTGVTDLAEVIPVGLILDRAYPNYNYPQPLEDPAQLNYRAFVRSHVARGGRAEQFAPGSVKQIQLLREPDRFPHFQVQNLIANGVLWTGNGSETQPRFPALMTLKPDQLPTENMCSLAFRLTYGSFRYFSGGDMSHDTDYGAHPWRDIETPVAAATGPVTVAVANHHGYVDATGPAFVSNLRPRCFVINGWDSAHPTMPAMNNMLSQELYPGDRDIFSTACKPESKIAVRQLSKLASDSGHVVFRVSENGEHFQVFITSNNDESDTILKRFGPYSA
jgi:beta-lactamase superfamily II metal-dependent hydrolase